MSSRAEITNLSDAIDAITKLLISNTEYWFRGHSKSSYQLIPSVFRPIDSSEPYPRYYNEAKLISEFERRHPEAREKHQSTLELLTYAQHYGIPTRLLDWTENLLVALYFCCKDDSDDDGIIYYLKLSNGSYKQDYYLNSDLSLCHTRYDVFKVLLRLCLQLKDLDGLADPSINNTPLSKFDAWDQIEIRNWLANQDRFQIDEFCETGMLSSISTYRPPLINERLISQKGCFTVHGGKILHGREIVKVGNESEYFYPMLSHLYIPNHAKSKIIEQLKLCGIDEAALFPELEYQAKAIKEMCQ